MVRQDACFAGVDWATETHHVCVVSDGGAKREERTFRHGGAGLAEMAEWIAARSEGPPGRSRKRNGLSSHVYNPPQ